MLWFFEVAKCYGGYFEKKKIKGSERFRYFAYSNGKTKMTGIDHQWLFTFQGLVDSCHLRMVSWETVT